MGCGASTKSSVKVIKPVPTPFADVRAVPSLLSRKPSADLQGSRGGVGTPSAKSSACRKSPCPEVELFEEHLRLLQQNGAMCTTFYQLGFRESDCLLVVGMEYDVTHDSCEAGIRSGIPEAGTAASIAARLVHRAADASAMVIATCDLPPTPSAPCSYAGLPDPAPGFFPALESALLAARDQKGIDVGIVFNVSAEQEHDPNDVHMVSISASSVSNSSGLELPSEVTDLQSVSELSGPPKAANSIFGSGVKWSLLGEDLNARPDASANLKPLSLRQELTGVRRLFVVGLPFDAGVCDAAVAASRLGIASEGVYLIPEACRAAHVLGGGDFGSGFVADPRALAETLNAASINLVCADCLLCDCW